MQDIDSQVSSVMQEHITQMSKDIDAISTGREKLQLSIANESLLINLSKNVQIIFEGEQTLLEITPPIIIVGDLHGHILDLYRILKQFDLPPSTKYLFLGDIVDRGPFSLECVTLIFILKFLYPKHIYIIRGNHELNSICQFGGFFAEIQTNYYSRNAFDAFKEAFDRMPLAAKIGSVLCLHGGIAPGLVSLEQIQVISRPISKCSTPIISGILWSDPMVDSSSDFEVSKRGAGFMFSEEPFNRFLESNHLTHMFRGHECVDGISERFNKRLVTIFSASNYCGAGRNSSGVGFIEKDYAIHYYCFPPLQYIQRNACGFIKLQNAFGIRKRSSSSKIYQHENLLFAPKSKSNESSSQINIRAKPIPPRKPLIQAKSALTQRRPYANPLMFK